MDKNNKIYEIKPNTQKLHPLILNTINNNTLKTQYIVPIHFKNDEMVVTSNKQVPSSNKNPMLFPSILLDNAILLDIYNINTINDIIDFVNDFVNESFNNNTYYDTMNRILNCWIRQNFDDLKKNNNILSDIYFKIFSKYFPEIIPNETIFIKKTQSFFKVWFNKKKNNSFNINLGNDIKKFLSNDNKNDT